MAEEDSGDEDDDYEQDVEFFGLVAVGEREGEVDG